MHSVVLCIRPMVGRANGMRKAVCKQRVVIPGQAHRLPCSAAHLLLLVPRFSAYQLECIPPLFLWPLATAFKVNWCALSQHVCPQINITESSKAPAHELRRLGQATKSEETTLRAAPGGELAIRYGGP